MLYYHMKLDHLMYLFGNIHVSLLERRMNKAAKWEHQHGVFWTRSFDLSSRYVKEDGFYGMSVQTAHYDNHVSSCGILEGCPFLIILDFLM